MPAGRMINATKLIGRRRRYRRVLRKGRARLTSSLRANQVIVKRKKFLDTWTFSSASTSGFWRYYTLTPSDFNNFSEMAAVFDSYKVNAIKLEFVPRFTEIDGSAATTPSPNVRFHTCIDPDNTVTPTGTYSVSTLNTFLENSGVRSRLGNRVISVYYKPKIMLPLATGTSQASMKSNKMWLKTNDTTASYFGVHAFIQTNAFSTTAPNVIYDVYATFYASFRHMK